MTGLYARIGVGGRLLLAFLGISGFAAVGAVAGIFSFLEIGDVLNRITRERVPSALAAQEVSRQSERVVSSAPMLLTVTNDQEREARLRIINTELDRLDVFIKDLDKSDFSPSELTLIQDINRQFRENLPILNSQIRDRLTQVSNKRNALDMALSIYDQIQQLLEPWVLVTEARITKWRDAIDNPAKTVEERDEANSDLKESLSWLRSLHELQLLLTSVSEKIQRLAISDDLDLLKMSSFKLVLQIRKANELILQLDPKLRPKISVLLKKFESYVVGPQNILGIRQSELAAIAEAEQTLARNAQLSQQLTEAANDLVQRAQNDILAANKEASSVQKISMFATNTAVVLSFLCSVLIVWLYVGRNVMKRLKALSDSMLAIAGGNLNAPLPTADGRDEISHMAEALTVFRDTAVEVEEKNLREIEETRRRLIDAIENTSEGFAFYDNQDRLELCNMNYKKMLGAEVGDSLKTGMPFEAIIRFSAESGLVPEATGRVEEWVADRLERHRNPGEPHLHRLRDSRWLLISEHKTNTGGIVVVYADVTELKQREEELADKSDALEKKSNALEQLSNQLAKYLSPQVYDSIFLGKQEVKVASSRKKLTVFFSDIEGFTETADRLESEELTQLLNHYLTEMSKIALDHGATIDKYVGDAILIFFGDPETKGVREDALSCIRMSIQMRKRMLELKDIWRDSGIEKPLRVRMGIHTGYCTVGNFGSEDRMDYTIIGGAVNTASRLETLATPGEILISYETYALIKDEIKCEEFGEIEVKGIAYPVVTYQVVDSYENLASSRQHICESRPNFKIDLDIDAMTPDDRVLAETILRQTLDVLSNCGDELKSRKGQEN